MSKRARPEFIPMYIFYGPERPATPGNLGPYTGEAISYRGYSLHRRNQWHELFQQWDCCETPITVVGPGADWVCGWHPEGWRARVAGITSDGESMQEALDDAWRLAESEGQLRHLVSAGVVS